MCKSVVFNHATLSIYSGNSIDWLNGRTVINSILLEELNHMRMFLFFSPQLFQERIGNQDQPDVLMPKLVSI